MKFKIILIAALAFFHLTFASTSTVERLAKEAIALRSDRNQERHKELILAQAIHQLPDYGEHQDLKTAVSLLLKSEMNFDQGDIVYARETPFYGSTEDEIFFVRDREKGAFLYVVKAFNHPELVSGKLLPEVSAMLFLEELQIETLKGVRPLAAGKCTSAGKPFGLLVESVATGRRLDQYILDITDLPLGDPERIKRFQKVIHIFEVIGRNYAKLQKVNTSVSKPLTNDLFKKLQNQFRNLEHPQIITLLEGKLDLEAVKDEIKSTTKQLQDIPFRCAYQHGDPTLKNIFYNEERDGITLIDIHRMHHSIDSSGNPQSDGCFDFVRISEVLKGKICEKLTDEEAQKLREVFKRSFLAEGGYLDPRPIHLHTLMLRIRRFKNFQGFDPSNRLILNNFEKRVKELKELIPTHTSD
jgi:hypothetical protein